MEKRLFTSESVTEGHPDKICDAVSDAVLDALMEQDPFSRVACETCTNTGFVLVMGEITTKANIDIPAISRIIFQHNGVASTHERHPIRNRSPSIPIGHRYNGKYDLLKFAPVHI